MSEACVVVFALCCAALLVSGLARLFSGTHAQDELSTAIALLSPLIILAAVAISLWRSVGRVRD